MIQVKKHVRVALGYFLLVGLLGIFLRLFFVTPVSGNFRYIVHAHSHIALLGWVYIALTSLIYRLYLRETPKQQTYRRIFWFTNITLLGMMFTFPFTGYALFSIIFSTLFLFASYFFAWFVFKNIPSHFKGSYSYKCIRAALWYMVISSIGPWAIGGVMATLGNTSIWYKLSIYLYLHFQYNAWFILVLCGVLFYLLEKYKLNIDRKAFQRFFIYLNLGLILTLFLSALWINPPIFVYVLGALGAVFQVMAIFEGFEIVRKNWSHLKAKLSSFVVFLLKLAGIFLAGKILFQLISAIPFFAEVSFNFPDFIIGYLHWVFLGVVSIALFAFLYHFNLLKLSKPLFWIYFTGFVLSEILIFYKGISLWLGLAFFTEYFTILVSVSSLMPIAIAALLIENLLPERKEGKTKK